MNKKAVKFISLIVAVLLSVSVFVGCGPKEQARSIASITKTDTDGLTDYYTVTFTDGTTFVYTVENGKDGERGEGMDVDTLYNDYLKKYPNATYADFLSAVLSVTADENEKAVNKLLRSTAKVYAEFTESTRIGSTTSYKTFSNMGSAVIYDIGEQFTYLVTNYHVVYSILDCTKDRISKKIVCYLYGSEGVPTETGEKDSHGCVVYDYGKYGLECEFVGGSASVDLAVVRVPTPQILSINCDIRGISFADGYSVGQTAIAVGNPNGEGISVTKGIVSVDSEVIKLSVDGTERAHRSIRIDTPMYDGNSGGGLFDQSGRLIGIANAGSTDEQNVNYAIPLPVVKNTVEGIIYYAERGEKKTKKLSLGIQTAAENSRYAYDADSDRLQITEKVVVTAVKNNSAAHGMGLSVGDEILSVKINGKQYPILRVFEVEDLMLTVREGDNISLGILRLGETLETDLYTAIPVDMTEVD